MYRKVLLNKKISSYTISLVRGNNIYLIESSKDNKTFTSKSYRTYKEALQGYKVLISMENIANDFI